MVEEYASVMKNNFSEVVLSPKGKINGGIFLCYKIKHGVDRIIEKFMAIFVAMVFLQVKGIDYDEKFSLVASYFSVMTIIALEAQMGWKIHPMDVKETFFNGVVEEEIYIK